MSIPASNLLVRWLPLLAFCAVVLHHFLFLNNQAMNIPYQDDIYDFLEYIVLADASDSFAQALEALNMQYNDHRTSASRLQVYGAYVLQGEVNFRTLTFLSNLALPMILLLLSLSARGEKYRWTFLLVSALLLLHLRAYELVLFSQGAFAYYYIFFYAFACLFALHKVNFPKFLLAVVLCTLCTYTYASGQVVWLLGAASLLHQSLFAERKPFLYIVAWLLTAAGMLALWRVGFVDLHSQAPVNVSPESVRAVLPDALLDASWHQILIRYVSFFLVILGSAFTASSALLAGSIGLIMAAILSFLTVKFYRLEDTRLVLCCWFVVASAAAVTVGRAMMAAPNYVLDSRYSFLSIMFLITLLLLAQMRLARLRSPAVLLLTVALSGAYWSWAHSDFERPLQNLVDKRYSHFNSGRFLVFGKPKARGIVREAMSEGIYNPPCRPFPMCESPP
jgi:hypothetical protein